MGSVTVQLARRAEVTRYRRFCNDQHGEACRFIALVIDL